MDDSFQADDAEDLETCAARGHAPRHHGPYRVRVNGHHVILVDLMPTARQILDAARLHPADEHVLLMERRDGMLVDVNLDDTVDLRHHAPVGFDAFHSARMIYLELDGRRFLWGTDAIPEPRLRRLGQLPDAYGIWLERKGQEDLSIARGSSVDLSGADLHRFYSGAEQTTAGRGALPERDSTYLAERGIRAEIIEQAGQQAVLLRDYPLPPGKYDAARADVLVLLPSSYPDSGPDMFYTLPWLRLRATGGYAPQADVPHAFGGATYQRWSRHSTLWRPGVDGIRSVLLRIDAALRDAR